jgi:hypothetical protein
MNAIDVLAALSGTEPLTLPKGMLQYRRQRQGTTTIGVAGLDLGLSFPANVHRGVRAVRAWKADTASPRVP